MVNVLTALQHSLSHSSQGIQPGPITWRALNKALAIRNSPVLGLNDYDSFHAFSSRYDQDPELKNIVDRFDNKGLVIKTGTEESNVPTNEPSKGSMEQRAKRAARRAFS